MGDIGRRVAEVGAALGMTVWGCRRGGGGGDEEASDAKTSPSHVSSSSYPYVSETFGMGDEQLRAFLGWCDYVVNLLPSTSETRGLLSAERLAWCKRRRREANDDVDKCEDKASSEEGTDTAGTVFINVVRAKNEGDTLHSRTLSFLFIFFFLAFSRKQSMELPRTSYTSNVAYALNGWSCCA